MKIDGWRYYNHAAIPTTNPDEEPNLAPIKDGTIWKIDGGRPLFARWTADWDCGYETEWWYCIKDTPFDISSLKSKRRYEINKGNNNFDVEEVNAVEYAERFYEISNDAYETYPTSYKPHIENKSFVANVRKWNDYKDYGAFSKEDGKIYGWARLGKVGQYIDFTTLKVCPQVERLGINAAIIYKILKDHEIFLKSGGYICDGARPILHKTAFQDYLEKYFDFRKAYCKLHVIYKPFIKRMICMAYPFRRLISKLDRINVFYKLNSLLNMEEIKRTFE